MAKPLGIVAMLTQFTTDSKASVIHHFKQFDSFMKSARYHRIINKNLT